MIKKISVENGVQAKSEITNLIRDGYTHDNIYLFAHDKRREEDLTEALNVEEVGMAEKGIMNTMKNLVVKRGDELRNEFEAVGLSHAEAEECERALDRGELIIVAKTA